MRITKGPPAGDRPLEGGHPVLCDTMFFPPGGCPEGQQAEWMLLAQKCMTPAVVIAEYDCPRGHTAQNPKCGPHSTGGHRFCGLCAFGGEDVPVRLTATRPLP